uniref:Uncharacterized protein n=1 Tax=Rhizophora mucronata TaxID=61149 RepID=A0A2P2QCC8_RHIMU
MSSVLNGQFPGIFSLVFLVSSHILHCCWTMLIFYELVALQERLEFGLNLSVEKR